MNAKWVDGFDAVCAIHKLNPTELFKMAEEMEKKSAINPTTAKTVGDILKEVAKTKPSWFKQNIIPIITGGVTAAAGGALGVKKLLKDKPAVTPPPVDTSLLSKLTPEQKAMLIGGIGGAVTGGAIGALKPNKRNKPNTMEDIMTGILTGGVAGTALGGAYGYGAAPDVAAKV